jgi:hypothetical protein
MHLSDHTFKRLRVPEKGRVTYNDDSIPGFGVRVSASGVKSFVLLVGRSRKRITIGRYPLVTLAQARARAIMAYEWSLVVHHVHQTHGYARTTTARVACRIAEPRVP